MCMMHGFAMGLMTLQAPPSLAVLEPSSCRLTPAAMRGAGDMHHLNDLSLLGSNVDDAGLAANF